MTTFMQQGGAETIPFKKDAISNDGFISHYYHPHETANLTDLVGQMDIWRIARGRAGLNLRTEDGRSIRICTLEKGNWGFPIPVSTDSLDPYYLEASFLEETEFCVMDQRVRARFQKEHAMMYSQMMCYSQNLRQIMQTLADAAFIPLRDRIYKRLLEASRQQRGSVVRITHEELANELGSSREVISRQMKMLEREKLLLLQRGRVTLLNTHK